MGRPRLKIDPDQVRKLAQLGCSLREIGAILGCDHTTIHKRFSTELELGDARGKIQLRRAQHLRAVRDKSDTMLIHLGKHRLDQRDKPESSDVNALFDDAISEPDGEPEIPPVP